MTDSTEEILIIDCAFPPSVYPKTWNGKPIQGCCVYTGGNTPHVWTDAEIARMMAQPGYKYLVPIHTRSKISTGLTSLAQATKDALAAFTWAEDHHQPSGTLYMFDLEDLVDSVYVNTVNRILLSSAEGLKTLAYGQKSTVTENVRPSGGFDIAEWTFHDDPPADTASQFASYALYDVNRFRTDAPIWNFRPDPKPPTVTPPKEPDMPYLISVTPDPTKAPGNTNAGIFCVDAGQVTHVPPTASGVNTEANLAARHGAPVVVARQYYLNLLSRGAGDATDLSSKPTA